MGIDGSSYLLSDWAMNEPVISLGAEWEKMISKER